VATKEDSMSNSHFMAATVLVDLTVLTIEPVTMTALHARTISRYLATRNRGATHPQVDLLMKKLI
jgi:hypothetical protein